MDQEIFSQLEQLASQGDLSGALGLAAEQFRREHRPAELFEVLKMRARHEVGWPLMAWEENAAEPSEQQARLEQALYRACEEVGELLFASGKPALAWKYFQLVGNRPKAAQLLRAIPVSDDVLSELIHVGVEAGVDPVYGLELTIQHQGLCNAITTYDGHIAYEPRSVRARAAESLTRAIDAELRRSIVREIEAVEKRSPKENASLAELLAEFPWVLSDGRLLMDISHLAASVRIARSAIEPEVWRLASGLCLYGQGIDAQYRPEGTFPFDDHFGDHRIYFDALQGVEWKSAIEHFRRRAEEKADSEPHQRGAHEVVVAILLTQREYEAALAISLADLSGQEGPLGLAPSALKIAAISGQLLRLSQTYRDHNNLLMYTTAILMNAASPPADANQKA